MCRRKACVRTGRYGDTVFAIGGYEDQRDPGGCGVITRDMLGIDPVSDEALECSLAELITTHSPHEADLATRPARCNRLIRALAPRHHRESSADQGFAGSRQTGDSHDHVRVTAPHDDDLCSSHHTSLPTSYNVVFIQHSTYFATDT